MGCFVLLFLSALYAFAQSEVGGATLTGIVTDPQGAAVTNAKVRASNPQTGFSRSLDTTEAGLFNFVRLPVGSYDLSVEFQGFKTFKRESIQLGVGAVVAVNVQLEVGAVSEAVTVTGETPVVETTRSQTSTTVGERAVRDLPINGRNFLDFTVLTPGVVRDPRGGDLSFGGQRGTLNSLLIDGGDSNNIFFGQSSGRAGTRNPYTFSMDAVGEFQVNTNTFAAEVGRAGGGVVNVITKSGTNDLHGTAFWFFRDRTMNANTYFNNQRNIARQPYHFNQFGGNLGGPVAKNKLFYFVNYDGQRNTIPNAVFYPIAPPADALSQQAVRELAQYLTPYVTGSDNNIGTVKIDWIGSGSRTVNVRYNVHRFTGKNFESAGAQSAAEHTGNSEVRTSNIAANYTQLLGTTRVWDARFIYLSDDEPGSANTDSPEVTVREAGRNMIVFGRNFFSPRFTNSKRVQTIQALSWNRGAHAMKFGGDVNIERIDNFFPGNFGGRYTFNTMAEFAQRRPAQYIQGFAGSGTNGALTKPDVNEFALFAQDSWRVSQGLTLNYGARYDGFDYAAGTVKNPDAGLAAQGLDTSRIDILKKTFAGRFGFAWTPKGSAWMVVRGGIGNYFARVPSILTGTAHSQNGIQVLTFTLRGTVPAEVAQIPAYPKTLSSPPTAALTPDIYVVEPKFKQPQTYQWSLNVEMRAAAGTAVTLGYLGVRGLHLSRTRNINFFPGENIASRFADGSATSFLRFPVARPNPRFGRISVFESGGDSIYNAGFIQVSKRYAKRFQAQASYTFSRVIDTAPDATSVVVGGGDDSKLTQNNLYPNLDRGLGDADVTHRLVVSGLWDIDYYGGSSRAGRTVFNGWQLSVIAQTNSGRPYSAGVNVDLNADSNLNNDRPPFVGRNTVRGSEFSSVDVRVSKDIPLHGERWKLRLMGEAFNLFNTANFSSFNRPQYLYNAGTNVFTPATNFGTPTNTTDPRILQVAARITF